MDSTPQSIAQTAASLNVTWTSAYVSYNSSSGLFACSYDLTHDSLIRVLKTLVKLLLIRIGTLLFY